MTGKEVTILVPNYRTPDITKICMRLIRRYTDFSKTHVIVIDNASADASVDYLRTLDWIELIERQPEADDTPPLSHSRALDLALDRVTTPFVLSIHTDTFVRRREWIDVMLAAFSEDERLAGVGSWKLESKTIVQRWGRLFEQAWKTGWMKISGRQTFRAERFDDSLHYLRSHCAMYRTNVIRELDTNFSDGRKSAGCTMHHKMVTAGYRMKFLDSVELGQYVDHLNHATMILNPELGSSSGNVRRGGKRLKDRLRGIDADAILADDSLDR